MTGEPKIEPGNMPAIVQTQLINRFNILHFTDETFLVVLRHLTHDYDVQLRAAPLPSIDQKVSAVWIKDSIFPPDLHNYKLENIIIPGTRRAIEFLPESFHLDSEGVNLTLPEAAYEIFGRDTIRHLCRQPGVKASLIQHSVAFSGELLDFSPQALRVLVQTSGPQNFFWLNQELPAMLIITKDDSPIYSGQVKLLYRDEGDGDQKLCVLEPLETSTPRFQPRKYRARRELLRPSPDIVFVHPLTGRKCTIKVKLLSSLGFSVEEQERTSVLLAGLLLPEVELSFANSFCLKCTAQVVFRGPSVDGTVTCGIAILDIDLQDHLKLASLIQQAQDQYAYVSNQVDPEALFEFFFETGFLYPHKYSDVADNRKEFKEAYVKLYEEASDLTRHFVYQDNGHILGHFSTIRTHRSTWMSHHHAALPDSRAGLKVVRAIAEFTNDSYFLNPVNMKYITGFFRPENRFPAKFFGGFYRTTDNRNVTSIDEFAYIRQADDVGKDWHDKPGEWEISRANDNDIHQFRGFYKKYSDGLMANAFDLDIGAYDDSTLSDAYLQANLKRFRHFYAVRHNDSLKALVEVQDSVLGLNMSELTNAIMIYVLDQKAFHKKLFQLVIFALSTKHKKQQHPVMVFPREYAEKNSIQYEKEYNLWTLNLKHLEYFMDWLYKYCRKM